MRLNEWNQGISINFGVTPAGRSHPGNTYAELLCFQRALLGEYGKYSCLLLKCIGLENLGKDCVQLCLFRNSLIECSVYTHTSCQNLGRLCPFKSCTKATLALSIALPGSVGELPRAEMQ